jgi:hypothetical protein
LVAESSDFMATLVEDKRKKGVAYSGSRAYFKATDIKYGKHLT